LADTQLACWWSRHRFTHRKESLLGFSFFRLGKKSIGLEAIKQVSMISLFRKKSSIHAMMVMVFLRHISCLMMSANPKIVDAPTFFLLSKTLDPSWLWVLLPVFCTRGFRSSRRRRLNRRKKGVRRRTSCWNDARSSKRFTRALKG
jgi:hypothetical protein